MRAKRTTRAPRFIAGMSGAAAAAGDLARARKQAQEVAEEVDPALVEAARQFLSACETYLKGLKMYREGYPALERFRTQLDDKLRAYIEKHGDLEVSLTAMGLDVDERIVYQAERVEQNIWFVLFRDGVRQLTFEDGLDREETLKFLKVLSQLNLTMYSEDAESAEDDAVTALWDADLQHIRYVVIDTYVESASDQNRQAERIREIVTLAMTKEFEQLEGAAADAARRLFTTTLTNFDFETLAKRGLAALDEVPENLRAIRGDVYTIEDGERRALVDGLQSEQHLFEKFLASLVQSLVEGTEDAGPVCNRIEQLFTGIVKDQRFARAAELRRQVEAGVRVMAFGDVGLVAQVDKAMSSDVAIQAIIDALVDLPDDQAPTVMELVEVMPDLIAPQLLKGLAKVTERGRRRAVCEVAASWSTALDAAVVALRDASAEYSQDLLVLARRAGGEKALVVLENATRHEAPAVRTDALRLLAEIAQPAVVDRRARTALTDPDADVRAAGLELLVKVKSQNGFKAIKDMIASKQFEDVTLEEKQRMFLAFAMLGGEEAAKELVERAGQRNMMMKATVDDERAAAATVLGSIQFEDARSVLEKLAKGKLVRAHVREACTEALARLDRAAGVDQHSASPAFEPPPQEQATGEAPPAPRVSFKATTTRIPKLEQAAAAPAPPAPRTTTRSRTPTSPAMAVRRSLTSQMIPVKKPGGTDE